MSSPVTPAKRATLNLRRLLSILLVRVRRAVGILLQLVQRDQLRVLTHETRRLSSASVESVTYLGAEMKNVEERLARLEEEVASLRRAQEDRAAGPDEAAPERSTSS